MSYMDDTIPMLSETCQPPIVRGTADLADFANQGKTLAQMLQRIEDFQPRKPPPLQQAARTYDQSIASQFVFRRAEGLDMQDQALALTQIFRVGAEADRTIRLLALLGPGDMMANTPLDFLTNYLDIRLDLLYVLPDRPLPPVLPDHDIAFFGLGEPDPGTFARLNRLFALWPRPVLNNPRFLPVLERDTLSRSLAGIATLCSPTAVAASRSDLEHHIRTGAAIPGFNDPRGLYPCLVRPASSHAGIGLKRVASVAEMADFLRLSFGQQFFVTAFEDYASADGLYRKSRVAFIDRQPFLCHMAVSSHWMVHYLNAGMADSAEKRADEAQAMAEFDTVFARRHADAFAALHERLGFDYYSIDCAETRDGRLLVFEADTAAIVHLMDPPDMFPYKQPQMRRVFAAFEELLRRRIRQGRGSVIAEPRSAAGLQIAVDP